MIKSGGMQFFFSILLAVIQLLVLRLLHEYFEPLELGLYSLAMMLIFLLQSFCDMGISSFSINNNNDSYLFNKKLHQLSSYIGVVSLFLGGFASVLLAYFYKADTFIHNGIILSLSFPFLTLTGFYQSILVRKKKLITITFYDFISRAASLVILYIMLEKGQGFDAFIYSYLVYSVIRWVLYLIKSNSLVKFITLKKQSTQYVDIDLLSYRKFFSFMIYQFMSQFINSVSVKIDEMVLGKVLGLEVLGIYTLLKNYVVQIGYLILPLIRRMSLSMLVGKLEPTLEYIKLNSLFSYITVSYFIGAAVLSQLALVLVFGGDIERYHYVFIILLMTWAVRISGGSVLSSFFVVKGKPEYDFLWNLLQSGIIALVAMSANYDTLDELALYIFFSYSCYVFIAMPVFSYLIGTNWKKSIYISVIVIAFCSLVVIFSNKIILLTLSESAIVAVLYSAFWGLLSALIFRKKRSVC